jgi:hypothetical protein
MASIYDYENITTSEFTTCQECGELICWRDSDYVGGTTDDDQFSGIIDKLIYHMKNDPKCVRERKLNELFGTKEKLAQDYYLK